MRSLRIYKSGPSRPRRVRAGLTLIEILVVLGIFALLVGLGLPISLRSYETYSFQSEYERVIGALSIARNRAMNNLSRTGHSVCYDAGAHQLQIAAGTCQAPIDREDLGLPQRVGLADWPSNGIQFEQLSGNTAGATIEVSDGEHSETVIINEYGGINW
ncbi:MAG: prepilin-type N-terminal cleavage/methylation domain-containing protein [Patescibacteria group bacterium]|nr:prepilin-type N-terminal cleavage/methylation domain-containing protein [Patescibacteria group bacterium]